MTATTSFFRSVAGKDSQAGVPACRTASQTPTDKRGGENLQVAGCRYERDHAGGQSRSGGRRGGEPSQGEEPERRRDDERGRAEKWGKRPDDDRGVDEQREREPDDAEAAEAERDPARDSEPRDDAEPVPVEDPVDGFESSRGLSSRSWTPAF
jgi:hypothetical protein